MIKPKLSSEIAEKFARRMFEKDKNEEEKEWHIFHSKSVGDTALILAENKKVDKELLKIAGWLHDIGQTVSLEDHAINSLKLAEKEFEISEKLKDCILNHGNSGNPICEEAKLINIADKVSMLNPAFLSLLVKYTAKKPTRKEKGNITDTSFIKMMLSKAGDLLENI
jgi:putative nucleotidyltransferase with HDIG domain